MTTNFLLLFLDPGSGMGKKSGSGIRDKHPGSATLKKRRKYLYGSNCMKQCSGSGSGLDPDPSRPLDPDSSWEFGSGSRKAKYSGSRGWRLPALYLSKKLNFIFNSGSDSANSDSKHWREEKNHRSRFLTATWLRWNTLPSYIPYYPEPYHTYWEEKDCWWGPSLLTFIRLPCRTSFRPGLMILGRPPEWWKKN